MQRLFLIIDGYNLMHAAGFARRNYGPGDLHRCRQRFIGQLSSLLSPNARQTCTIVFDAFESPLEESPRQFDTTGLTIEFAPAGTDADSTIEEKIQQHSAPRQVMVVSSDHRFHKAARRRKSRCVDSEDFWAELNPDPHARRNQMKDALVGESPEKLAQCDEQFEQEFLGLNVDQITRELRTEDQRRRKS